MYEIPPDEAILNVRETFTFRWKVRISPGDPTYLKLDTHLFLDPRGGDLFFSRLVAKSNQCIDMAIIMI